uniref:Uncharacterized protein n=1 Tax=Magnetococcus massalia (strain MO-1) TaxID=451514 RepID=A0A1S7LH25_MAGMO|nr:Conserved protein of unknown function [Candidatus Magnetococcus massalia]
MSTVDVVVGGTYRSAQNTRRLDTNSPDASQVSSPQQQTMASNTTNLNATSQRVNDITRAGDEGNMAENASRVAQADVDVNSARPGGIIDIRV